MKSLIPFNEMNEKCQGVILLITLNSRMFSLLSNKVIEFLPYS